MSTYDQRFFDFQNWEHELLQPGPEVIDQNAEQFEQAKRAAGMNLLVLDAEFVKQRAQKLGMLSTRQYHKLPLQNCTWEVLSSPIEPEPTFLQVTHNVKIYRPGLGPHVKIYDYILGLKTHSLATYSGEVWLQSGVKDLPPSSPPIIWRSKRGDMRLYPGAEHKCHFPLALDHYQTLVSVNAQRQGMAMLEGLLRNLGEGSLEETYEV